MKFQFVKTNEILTPISGLACVGALLSRTNLRKRLNAVKLQDMQNPDIKNGDIAIAYIGLLCQGKNDFDSIELFRQDPFFKTSLGNQQIPSSPTLRQRMDIAGNNWNTIILEESARLIRKTGVKITPCHKELVPLDIDVSCFDNSKTHKEGVSRTYKGYDGYSPIFAYLGQEGYGVNTELREGKQHCQKDTDNFLAQSIRYAKIITDKPLLVRMDSGNDSIENIKVCLKPETKADYLIKRNLRKESLEEWLQIAREKGRHIKERDGKDIYYGDIFVTRADIDKPLRIAFKVTVQTIDDHGQILICPDIEADTYYTSLTDPAEIIDSLYADHGTSEQFHSELKTDMDLERLPSGKFDTNNLILHLGILAYNILKIMGQESLNYSNAPIKKQVYRKRIRKVIQNLITIASRVISHGRRLTLGFGRYSPWFETIKRVYQAFAY
jgi:hypothetical protein